MACHHGGSPMKTLALGLAAALGLALPAFADSTGRFDVAQATQGGGTSGGASAQTGGSSGGAAAQSGSQGSGGTGMQSGSGGSARSGTSGSTEGRSAGSRREGTDV